MQIKGNLINELDNANPTALLASAYREKRARTRRGQRRRVLPRCVRDGELWQLHHIMAGGPSRGTMALETETAPGVGTCVQVCLAIFSSDFISTHTFSFSIVLRGTISRRPRESCERTPSRLSLRPRSATTRRRLWRKVMTTTLRSWRTASWLRARMDSC
jgi:hypothetical protein